ncbi:MAG: DUF4271 domain-containing protein [Prolixibacteraceae bacterium]
MIKFQQDTSRRDNNFDPRSESFDNELQLEHSQTEIKPIQEREASIPASGSAGQSEQKANLPTAAQLRYWWWQKEQKLTVGDSRYIQPSGEVELAAVHSVQDKELALPNREVHRQNADWLTILLIVILVLFASVRTTYSKYLNSLFQSIFNYSTSQRMFQEKNYSFLHAAFRLEIYFYLTFAIFLYQVFNFVNVGIQYRNISLFFFSLGLVLVYFIGKKAIYKLIGFVVEGTYETSEYLFNLDNINRVMGVTLFPIIALVAFYPFENRMLPLIVGVISVVFLYFLLLFRGFKILLRKQFSIFYLFLYFCTLEFLPLVLLYKIVVI